MIPETGPVATIFIVEDDEAVRSALGLLVRSSGWEARLFASAQEFLGQPQRTDNGPVCLVVDLHMPGMNGAELLEQLSAADCQIPAIVLTAWPEGEMASRALAAGADKVLGKPCEPDYWLSAVNTILAE
jgi:FixJ family two-component response regulator